MTGSLPLDLYAEGIVFQSLFNVFVSSCVVPFIPSTAAQEMSRLAYVISLVDLKRCETYCSAR